MSASFEYNPFASYVDLRIECPRCGTIQHLNLVPPMADLAADSHSESCNDDYLEEECENCGYGFEISLTTGIGGGDGMIHNIPEENLLECHEEFDEDDFWDDIPESVYTDFLDPHVKDIAVTLDKIDPLDQDAKLILYRSLYAGVIGAFEAYLSDTLISKIMRNDAYKRKFVENSKQMQETKFSLSDIYNVQAKLDNMVIQRLQEILYHNLAVVGKLYEAVLDVKFPEYSELAKSVSIRHDIVHRNGKDKKGNQVNVTKEDVSKLVENVSDFIKDIDSQIYVNEHPEESIETDKTLDMIFGTENSSSDSTI